MIGKHVVLTLMVGAAIYFMVWQHRPAVWTIMPIAGVSLLAAGFVLWTIARFQLGSAFAVTAQAQQLVTHGLYSRIRNPIYVFGSCVVAGGILLVDRPIWLLVFFVLIPLQMWRSRKESQVLEEKFGEEYSRYRAGTWF